MIMNFWRDVREAYHDAVKQWVAGNKEGTILLLRLAIRRTETLISVLERLPNDKTTNR